MRKRTERKDEMRITETMAINARVRRQDAGLSLYRLACRAGCTPQTIVNLEQRHTDNIKIHNFESLATALGVNSDELTGEDRYAQEPVFLSSKVASNLARLSSKQGFGDDIEGYLEWRFRPKKRR